MARGQPLLDCEDGDCHHGQNDKSHNAHRPREAERLDGPAEHDGKHDAPEGGSGDGDAERSRAAFVEVVADAGHGGPKSGEYANVHARVLTLAP